MRAIAQFTSGQITREELIGMLASIHYALPSRHSNPPTSEWDEDIKYGESGTLDEVMRAMARGDIDQASYLELVHNLNARGKAPPSRPLSTQARGPLAVKDSPDHLHGEQEE